MKSIILVGKALGSFLLIILSLVLFLLISIISLGFTILSPIFIKDNRNIGEIIEGLGVYFISIAAAVDQTGNAAFGSLLTWGLVDVKKAKHSVHVDIDDTISEITGWNELEDSQTKLGKRLSTILNFLDKDHGVKSAASAYWKAKNKVERYKDFESILLKYKK